ADLGDEIVPSLQYLQALREDRLGIRVGFLLDEGFHPLHLCLVARLDIGDGLVRPALIRSRYGAAPRIRRSGPTRRQVSAASAGPPVDNRNVEVGDAPRGRGAAAQLSQDFAQVGPKLRILRGELQELLKQEVEFPADLAKPGLVFERL